MIYSCNKSQQDTLFLNFILVKNSACFGQTYLSIIRSLNTVFTAMVICHTSFVDCLLADSQHKITNTICCECRSQWPRGLRRRFAAVRLLGSWVRIPPGAWMFVCCECCVLSGRGLCDELITRPEESYRLWGVVVCDPENLKHEEAMTLVGLQRHRKKKRLLCIRY